MAYPAGQQTYASAGTVQKTARRFSANILNAVKLTFEAAERSGAASAPK
jgi:hypothetical protein